MASQSRNLPASVRVPTAVQSFRFACHIGGKSIDFRLLPFDGKECETIAKMGKLNPALEYAGLTVSGVSIGTLDALMRQFVAKIAATGEVDPFFVLLSAIDREGLRDLPAAPKSWDMAKVESSKLDSALRRLQNLFHTIQSVFQASYLPNFREFEAASFQLFTVSLAEINHFYKSYFQNRDFDEAVRVLCNTAFNITLNVPSGDEVTRATKKTYMSLFGLELSQTIEQLQCLREWPKWHDKLIELNWTLDPYCKEAPSILARLARNREKIEKFRATPTTNVTEKEVRTFLGEGSRSAVQDMALGFRIACTTQKNAPLWSSIPNDLHSWLLRAKGALLVGKRCAQAFETATAWSNTYNTLCDALGAAFKFELEKGAYTPDPLIHALYTQLFHATGDDAHFAHIKLRRQVQELTHTVHTQQIELEALRRTSPTSGSKDMPPLLASSQDSPSPIDKSPSNSEMGESNSSDEKVMESDEMTKSRDLSWLSSSSNGTESAKTEDPDDSYTQAHPQYRQLRIKVFNLERKNSELEDRLYAASSSKDGITSPKAEGPSIEDDARTADLDTRSSVSFSDALSVGPSVFSGNSLANEYKFSLGSIGSSRSSSQTLQEQNAEILRLQIQLNDSERRIRELLIERDTTAHVRQDYAAAQQKLEEQKLELVRIQKEYSETIEKVRSLERSHASQDRIQVRLEQQVEQLKKERSADIAAITTSALEAIDLWSKAVDAEKEVNEQFKRVIAQEKTNSANTFISLRTENQQLRAQISALTNL